MPSILSKILHPLLGRAKLDEDLQRSLVQSLYAPLGQFVFSMLIGSAIAFIVHSRTGLATFQTIGYLYLAVGGLRLLSLLTFQLAAKRKVDLLSLDHWEMLAFIGACSFSALVGVSGGLVAALTNDMMSQFLVTGTAMGYIAGIAGRNVARREIVIGQSLFSCTPFFIGLVYNGSTSHLLMAGVVALYGVLSISLASGLAKTVRDRHHAMKDLAFMAEFDTLTGLLNRKGFLDRLNGVVRNPDLARQSALIAIDLDRFKEINDSYGHTSGDQLLRNVGDRIKACIRSNDFAGRIAGDEFHVVLTEVGIDVAEAIAGRILTKIAQPHHIDGNVILSAASIGLSMLDTATDVKDAMIPADLALYKAKEAGRGRLTVFTDELRVDFERRKRIEDDLPTAIANGQIKLVYQPIVNSSSGQIEAVEALARWVHPELGFISPAEFIVVAERTAHIHALGDMVLREACQAAASWSSEVRIAVNVSACQFDRCDLLQQNVMKALAVSNLKPNRLELEITETAIISNETRTFETLRGLADIGVRISLDDFGVGHSSLRQIKDFAFDKIKIDRSFTVEAVGNSRSRNVIDSMAYLCEKNGSDLVVEGIETGEQMDCMTNLGVTLIQGYLYSKPVTRDAIGEMIASQPFLKRIAA